jgi:FdhD protein
VADSPAIRDLTVERVGGGGGARTDTDRIAVEEPLEFRVDGHPGAVTMRTPGHDEELVRGFLFAEGMIAEAGDVRGFERISDNIVNVALRSSLARKRLPERSTFASSSCGVCGKVSIESLHVHAPVVTSELEVAGDVIAGLPAALRAAQDVFSQTGGLHAAGWFDEAGALAAIREDVGRHNAVDKLVGWAVGEARVPASRSILCVSGRLSFEIVQKAVVAGFPIVAAVSAPSSAAVEVADEFGVTLCGFVREGRFNAYTHPNRVC